MITFSKLGSYGRFGNQLFQIASTIGIALKNNHSYAFPHWEYQKYFQNELPPFDYRFTYPVVEKTTGYSDIFIGSNDYSLEGYFQSYKYFDQYKDIIEYYFELSDKHLVTINDLSKQYVAIHVRRGDYLGLSHIHPNLSLEWYQKAMEYFPNEQFMIFSDDIEWCKDKFDNKRCTYILPVDDVLDWAYMRQCKGFIISASSYSWWAAYLSKDKPVVCPDVWAFNEPKETINDRLPEDWIRLEL